RRCRIDQVADYGVAHLVEIGVAAALALYPDLALGAVRGNPCYRNTRGRRLDLLLGLGRQQRRAWYGHLATLVWRSRARCRGHRHRLLFRLCQRVAQRLRLVGIGASGVALEEAIHEAAFLGVLDSLPLRLLGSLHVLDGVAGDE